MLLVGHWTSSSTVSHMRDARAWIHLPGQADTEAVLVTEPSRPGGRECEALPGLQHMQLTLPEYLKATLSFRGRRHTGQFLRTQSSAKHSTGLKSSTTCPVEVHCKTDINSLSINKVQMCPMSLEDNFFSGALI